MFPGLPSPTPFIRLGIGAQEHLSLVAGLFDTGASITSLRSIEQPGLGINDNRCIPMALTAANGIVTWQRLTMDSAFLDGHEFRIPLVFSPRLPINLFGRVGIMDLWKITLDPATLTTEMIWRGPQMPSGGRP
ncbi:MAG: hypothetical protein ACREN8_12815 [Candidatus Dormibacteraceae bacterium]